MNDQVQFIEVDSKIVEMLNYFPKHRSTLFHYTNNDEAANSIAGGTLHFTRADCFADDPDEISYGRGMLLDAALAHDESRNKDENTWLINTFGELLLNCFIFCATNQGATSFMHEKFGRKMIEFSSMFSTFYYHCTQTSVQIPGTDSYHIYQVPEIFDHLEGFVIYDVEMQKEIAKKAVDLIHHLRDSQGINGIEKISRVLDLRKVLANCMTLFKKPRLKDECEYRLCMIRNPNPGFLDAPSFDDRTDGAGRLTGKDRIYTAVHYRGIGNDDIKVHNPV